MKLGDKEINNLARNMRKCCNKRIACSVPNICKYKEKCHKALDNIGVLPNMYSIKELADKLRSAGL